MCEPLINKGYIKDTNIYRLRWVTKKGKNYSGNIYFDGDYYAYGEKDIPLTARYINDKGNEVKIDTFNSKDVKSAFVFYKKYRDNDYLLYAEHRDANKIYDKYLKKHKLTHTIERFNDWLFDYSFKDVI